MVGRGRHRPALCNEKALLGRKKVANYKTSRSCFSTWPAQTQQFEVCRLFQPISRQLVATRDATCSHNHGLEKLYPTLEMLLSCLALAETLIVEFNICSTSRRHHQTNALADGKDLVQKVLHPGSYARGFMQGMLAKETIHVTTMSQVCR